MIITRKTPIFIALLAIFIAFSSYGNDACARETGRMHQAPPPEAYTACEGKSAGDTAEFVSPHGDTVTGTCEQEGDRLVLRPDTPPDGRGRNTTNDSSDSSSSSDVDANSSDATAYAIVDTGQTACYDDNNELVTCPAEGEPFYGQDNQHDGHQPSYTDNSDGTITDNVTGLMWQQSPDTDGDGDIDADDKLTYDAAVAGAGTLNLGGYSDWRLPTIKELYSLIDFSGRDPSGYEGTDTTDLIPFIDKDYFDFAYGDTGAGERIIDSQFASSNLYVDNSAGSLLFGVNFADGRIKGYGLTMPGSGLEKTFFIIYVRGNTEYGKNIFADNGDGTITDKATDLMWSRDDSGIGLNWKDALAWVEAKNKDTYLGYSDWRLPNAKELQSIVDYTRSPGTTGSAAIDPLFNAMSITNEADQEDYPCYWSSTTHANWTETSGSNGAYVAFGRAMGFMDGTGAQRSDPKAGDPADYPTGNGPQGDVAFGQAMGFMDGTWWLTWLDVHGTWAQRSDPKVGDPADYPTGNGPQGDVAFGRAMGFMDGTWLDVHGAGAQRSDPKAGDPDEFPIGRGPQGDAIRIYNYVRLVRDAAGTTYSLPDTGQTACYDDNGDEISCPESGEAFAGQDAQYDGMQPSFTDNGDNTVTDNVTGLMWQQVPDSIGLSWREAVDYCNSLELAGYDDWRIPTLKELFSISDFLQGWPYLDTDYFDLAGLSVSKDDQYWTNNYYIGTTAEGGSAAAFGVNHGTGHIKAYPARASGPMGNYVRAVRGNSYGVNDFVDNGDGTVTDRATGLMWQKADSGSGMDWQNALAYAENLGLAGYDDWHLPNVKELNSIVDYTRSPSASDAANVGPAIDINFFEITELASGTTKYSPDYGYFWTSTSAYFGTDSPEYYYAWYVAFGTSVDDDGADFHGAGAVRFDTKVEGGPLGESGERYYNYVRCVRSAQ